VATAHLASSTGQPTAGRTWTLTVDELVDGSLSVSGLPADRIERLSVCFRLRDLLTATTHTDDIAGEGDGALWRRYAYPQWVAVYAARTTVEYVAGQEPGG
jgi:hypothetical protein